MFKRESWIKNGFRMAYLEGGAGPTLLFLHGAGFIEGYENLLQAFSGNYHIIAPHLPGFGESDSITAEWDLDSYRIFINDFINSLGRRQIILVGHSFGGLIALGLSDNPAVKKIVVFNPSCKATIDLKFFFNLFVKKTAADAKRSLAVGYQIAHDFMALVIHHNIFRLAKMLLSSLNRPIPQIQKPTLCIWCVHDEVLSPETPSILKSFPCVTIDLIDGNHDWPLFYPELMIEKINSFCYNS
jgi:pimeloyl-ACP methyl ester carboxylesterase